MRPSDEVFEETTLYRPPSPLARYDRVFCWGIFCLALLLRAAYIKQLQASPLWSDLPVDLGYYRDWALRIARGAWMGNELFEQSPLYAYFLALIFKLFGPGLLAPRLIQIAIGAGTCVLIYRTGRLLFSPGAGLAAGLGAAVYGPFLFYDGMLMKEFLAVFFVTAMLYQLCAASGSQRGMLATSGICLGLSALVRDNLILLVPAVCLWLLVDPWVSPLVRRGPAREGLGRSMAFLFGVALVVVPVMARNYHVSGEFVLLTAGGGEAFYIGNNPQADGRYSPPPFVRASSVVEHEDFRAEAARRLSRPAGSISRKEASDYWLRQGLDWIAGHPGEYLVLLGRKLLIFWNHYELPDNHSYDQHRRILTILTLPLLTFGLLAPLAVLGVTLSFSRWRDVLVLCFVGGGYLASVMLFFNFGRYRMPIVPVLLLFAGYGLVELTRILLERRWTRAVCALAVTAVAFGICGLDLEDDPLHQGQGHAQLAELLLRAGRLSEAETESSESVRLLSEIPITGASIPEVMKEAYETRASILRALVRAEEAGSWDRRARDLAPASRKLTDDGLHQMEAGRHAAAALAFQKALEALGESADPAERAQIRLHLAEALHRAGRPREALEVVERVLAAASELPARDVAAAHYGEGLIYRDLGDTDKMRSHLHECLRLDPEHPRAEWIKQTLAEGPDASSTPAPR